MFYLFLKLTIGNAVKIFFRRIVVRGEENIPGDKPVIFVSNHPSAFMDPLVLGRLLEKPIYYFARADIFTSGIGNWFMEKAHVSPIYRMVDGADSLDKNDAVFAQGYKLLYQKKNLLLFGEGFTDEVFVRRVKPMKKGSLRIALGAENKFDFKLGVNIVCVGINYSDPMKFRSDLLISFSKPIEVRNYKELFLEHNNKAMLELNKEIYARLKNEVVHIENPEYLEFFEHLLILSRKGMNNNYYDENISLGQRWKYSKKLADELNKKEIEMPVEIKNLQNKCMVYFEELKNVNVDNDAVLQREKNYFLRVIYLFLGFPFFLFGMINNYPPVRLATFLSKKISKRPVFWSGTDMAFSVIAVPLYYFFFITVLQYFGNFQSAFHQLSVAFIYLAAMPLSGIFVFNYYQKLVKFRNNVKSQHILKAKKEETEKLKRMGNEIAVEIEKLFGVVNLLRG